MAQITVTKALSGFFNEGAGKRGAKDFLTELRALSVEEKRELAQGVVEITGDTLTQ